MIGEDQFGLTAAHILDDEVLCSPERLRRWASMLEWAAPTPGTVPDRQ